MYELQNVTPAPNKGRGRPPKYPLGEMEVGDSFSIDPEERKKIASAASWYGNRNGKMFSIRKHEGEIRVWRTK